MRNSLLYRTVRGTTLDSKVIVINVPLNATLRDAYKEFKEKGREMGMSDPIVYSSIFPNEYPVVNDDINRLLGDFNYTKQNARAFKIMERDISPLEFPTIPGKS